VSDTASSGEANSQPGNSYRAETIYINRTNDSEPDAVTLLSGKRISSTFVFAAILVGGVAVIIVVLCGVNLLVNDNLSPLDRILSVIGIGAGLITFIWIPFTLSHRSRLIFESYELALDLAAQIIEDDIPSLIRAMGPVPAGAMELIHSLAICETALYRLSAMHEARGIGTLRRVLEHEKLFEPGTAKRMLAELAGGVR
jgi:hypothetical protein